jgi:hypothetical protein
MLHFEGETYVKNACKKCPGKYLALRRLKLVKNSEIAFKGTQSIETL